MPKSAWTLTSALKTLSQIPISLHCWQGDDVGGFENFGGTLGRRAGGHRQLSRQGAHAGRTARRSGRDLCADSRQAPAESPRLLRRIRRHRRWTATKSRRSISRTGLPGPRKTDWASISIPPASRIPRRRMASRSSHRDKGIRQFWIEHCIRSREIGAAMGKALGKTCVTNVWIPDGMKDTPADRHAPARAARRIAGRRFQEADFAQAESGLRGTQTLRHRQRKLCRRLARILSGLRDQPEESC